MAQQKKSIDEIWKELNARPAPRPKAAAGASINIPGLGTITRVLPPAKPSLPQDATVEVVPLTSATAAPGLLKASMYDPAQAGVTQEQVSAYLATIQRLVNCLSDNDRGTRRQAAVSLQQKLINGDATTEKASPAMLQALMCGPLLSPFLALLHDITEKCRVVAVEVWAVTLSQVADVTPLVTHLTPELARRMGHLPVQEATEEVRLSLVQLAASLVSRAAAQQLLPALPDLALIMCRAQEDAYHEIKKAGASAVAGLARSLPGASLTPHTAKLVACLVANLSHPHSKVRVAELEALDALVAAGGVAAGVLKDVIVPGLRPVAYDHAFAVRDVLFSALARWMGAPSPAAAQAQVQAGEQCCPQASDSQLCDMLPLLLIGVTDPHPPTATLALQLVEAVGDAYLKRADSAAHSAQQDTSAAMQVDPAPAADAATTPMDCSSAATDATSAAAGDDVINEQAQLQAAVSACHLGAPYTGRPGAGARALARQLLPALLPPVITELTAWTVAQRAAAVRSLHTLLVLAEDAVQTQSLPTLLPSLCTAVGDEDVEVAGRVVKCVHVLGAHVTPGRWLPLMLDQLINARLSLGMRANALVVLSALMYTAGGAQKPLPAPLLSNLASTLASDEFRSALLVAGTPAGGAAAAQLPGTSNTASSETQATRAQLLSVCTNLIRWQGPACAQVSSALCTLLLALWGAESDTPPPPAVGAAAAAAAQSAAGPRAAVTAAMAELVKCCGAASWEALLDQHADALMSTTLGSISSWTPDSGGFLLLKALLLTAGPATLCRLSQPLYSQLVPLLTDPEGPATLRLAVLQLIDAALDEPSGRGAGLAGEAGAQLLLEAVLLPPLTWRAGKTAAAIRHAAVTAIASALRRGLLPAKVLMRLINDGTLLPLLAQELDEDWYVDVRYAACYVVQQLLLLVGPGLGHEPRRTLYVELLKRLDDSSNTVRVAACQALHAFCTTMQPDYCETNSGYLAAGVIIHMDDADVSVQDAACSVLEALGKVKPEVVRVEVLKVRERFRNKHCCDRVLAAL